VIQKELYKEVVDGKTRWSRWQLSDTHEWCCDGLKESPEIDLNSDGKFGFAIDEVICGDLEFDHTEEIFYCPYCGKKIVVVDLGPKIKEGETKTVKLKDRWKRDDIYWKDGTITKSARTYATYKIIDR
jgi:hypothetical protein